MAQNRLEQIRECLVQNKGGYVHYQRDEERAIAYLGLMNPENNLITGKMMIDLEVYVDGLLKWKTGKGLVIYSGNENFCLGLDKRFCQKNLTASFAQDLSYFITNILINLSKLPFVSVCILTGVTEELGAEIPLYCDYVLMHNSATISFNHASVGITPGLLGANRLCESVGKKVCMDLLLTCRVLSAKEAKKLKIVDGVIHGGFVINKATEWLSKKIDKNAIIVQSIKRICSCTNTAIGTYGCVFERNSFALLWTSNAHAVALNTLMPMSSSDESGRDTTEDEWEEVDVVEPVTGEEEPEEVDMVEEKPVEPVIGEEQEEKGDVVNEEAVEPGMGEEEQEEVEMVNEETMGPVIEDEKQERDAINEDAAEPVIGEEKEEKGVDEETIKPVIGEKEGEKVDVEDKAAAMEEMDIEYTNL